MECPKTTGESYSKTVTSGYMELGARQGWQCPICKRVLSPFTPECPCKGQGHRTITTTTVTTGDGVILDLSKRPDLTQSSSKDCNLDITTIYSNKGDVE